MINCGEHSLVASSPTLFLYVNQVSDSETGRMVSSHARFEIYISIKYLSFKIYRLKLGLILATPALMDIIETSGPDSYNKVGGRI